MIGKDIIAVGIYFDTGETIQLGSEADFGDAGQLGSEADFGDAGQLGSEADFGDAGRITVHLEISLDPADREAVEAMEAFKALTPAQRLQVVKEAMRLGRLLRGE